LDQKQQATLAEIRAKGVEIRELMQGVHEDQPQDEDPTVSATAAAELVAALEVAVKKLKAKYEKSVRAALRPVLRFVDFLCSALYC
jgi:hypothetical protein